MGLFDEQISRKPDNYPWAKDFIHAFWSTQWTPNEFNFKADYGQYKTEMTDQERQIVARTLSCIGQVEIAVKTFWAKLGDNLPHPSISDLGYTMANSEVVHNLAYEKLLDVLQMGHVFEENLKEPVVKGRVEYLRKHNKKVYSNNRKQYIYSIILFTLFVENVSLFSQFYTILWFNRFKNLLKDTAQQVAYTRLEEDSHSKVGITIINTLRQEYPEMFDEELITKITQEIQEAFKAESKLIDWMIGDYSHDNLSADILKEYIKDRMNESLLAIGFESPFEVDKEIIKLTNWTREEQYGYNNQDFFVNKPVYYSKNDKTYNEDDLFDD
jgi:ribonucleoside-diphosphate reductase beta chain